MSEKDREGTEEVRRHRPTSRLSRFAKLSSMTAQVTARQLGHKVAGAFRTEQAREEARKKALKTSAEQIAGTMGQLKGAAMKVGQMLSVDPELLPEEMTDALSTLQTEAPPMEPEMARRAVEDALGGAIEDFFEEFSAEPIGAASIGQVHRARTREGEDVAVKVQYPGIAASIESDLKNLGSLLNLARAQLTREQVDSYLAEVTEVIKRESDYLTEADALERFQVVLKDVPGVRVPVPVHELSRPTVLTMEYVEGRRLGEWLTDAPAEARNEKAEQLITAYIEMMHVHCALHADPHPGNFLVDKERNLVFLDLGCVRDYEPAFTDGLLEVIKAMWRGDIDAMVEAVDGMGFDRAGADPEVTYAWLELVLEPLLEDRAFHFGEWKINEKAIKFVKDNPVIMRFAPPREAIFYLRVLAGIRGLVSQHDVELNTYRIARAAVDKLEGR